LCLLFLFSSGVRAFDNAAGTAGSSAGERVPVGGARDNPCTPAKLLDNHDGTFHCGYCWQYGGIVPPYYGAFAEEFEANGVACGIQLVLTRFFEYPSGPLDAYVWSNEAGLPGTVLGVTRGIDPGPVALFPRHSYHDLPIEAVPVDGIFFAGYWADWSQQPCGYFLGEDQDGPGGGQPLTNIAPGIGYPTGWTDVSVIWGPTQAMGIGAWVRAEGTPVDRHSWGRIKSLYDETRR